MDLNTERKKKAGNKNMGILGIPKTVMLILLGIFLWFLDERVLGICAIIGGVLLLLIDLYYYKAGKDERRK